MRLKETKKQAQGKNSLKKQLPFFHNVRNAQNKLMQTSSKINELLSEDQKPKMFRTSHERNPLSNQLSRFASK